MPQSITDNLITMAGASIVPTLAFLWWAVRMSWAAATRNALLEAQLTGLGKSLDALKSRVDEHDDLKERLARMEQAVHDARGSLQRIENALHTRPVPAI